MSASVDMFSGDWFIQALPGLQQLQVINFDDCLLRTAGAKAIAKALAVGSDQLKVRYI